MDWMTVFGFLAGIIVVCYGLFESQSWQAFFNIHGMVLVVGGTFAATLITTPGVLFFEALRAAGGLLFKPKSIRPVEAIKVVTDLAEKARRMGNLAIENDGQGVGDGFLQFAIDACLATSDQKLAREILSQKIRQLHIRHTETANVFRTMSVLFPMFGLIGTIIGIVTVLQNISNPKNVGPAMGVALSTAFFGILFSNLLCVPVAGKLRFRSGDEVMIKELIAEGVLKIFFSGEIPSQIGMYLESFVRGTVEKRAEEAQPAVQGAARPAA